MANKAVKIPPLTPKGIDQNCEIVLSAVEFRPTKIRTPFKPAKIPKVMSKGLLGASNNKVTPIIRPTKVKGANQ